MILKRKIYKKKKSLIQKLHIFNLADIPQKYYRLFIFMAYCNHKLPQCNTIVVFCLYFQF